MPQLPMPQPATHTPLQGFVSLVGAGPGDPDLITVKALRRLRDADVVAYDRLVNATLLEECRQGAELVYVGKHGDGQPTPSNSQEEINRLLIDRARRGLKVVRLKGGDPFVFGRGGEEALALREAGIPFEVVPGISASVAVPAYAGIPVTHRHLASSVTVVAGHEDETKGASGVNWPALAQGAHTLVFLMAVSKVEHIATQLLRHGRPGHTPAAMIRWGTTPQQETVTATLATLAETVRAAELKPPATLVVGEVVGLRDRLRWFEDEGAAAWDPRRRLEPEAALASSPDL